MRESLNLMTLDFIVSDYCYETYLFALEKHEKNEVVAIPIIIRPCLWKHLQLVQLQTLPKEEKAVTTWENRDSAWLNVAEGIIKVVEKLKPEPITEDIIYQFLKEYNRWYFSPLRIKN